MAKKAKSTKQKSQEAVQKPKSQRALTEKECREAFRVFFVKVKRKLNLAPNLEAVIWTHLKSIKHDKPEDFEKGIENFGYKL
jgi:hypothetical protein